MKKTLGRLSVLWLALQVAACDTPAETRKPAEVRLSVAGALVPGETAILKGQGLSGVRSLTVEGKSVGFQVISDEEVRFQMPVLPGCEVDGRTIEVAANGALRTSGVLRLASALRLEVGETRALGATELACLQLPGKSEAYVLALHNFSRAPIASEPFFEMETRAGGDVTSQSLGSTSGSGEITDGQERPVTSLAGAATGAAQPYDPRYATAKEGDTLRFVDWTRSAELLQAQQGGGAVPEYTAVVLAVVGRQVIAVDTRVADLQGYWNPEVREKFRKAAGIVEKLALPAARAVLGADVEPLPGAGGRSIIMISSTLTQVNGTIAMQEVLPGLPWAGAPWSSSMNLVYLNQAVRNWQYPGAIARLMIHEMAHTFEKSAPTQGRGGASEGWYSEAVAVLVEDVAVRMSLQQEWQAQWEAGSPETDPRSASPAWPLPQTGESPWGRGSLRETSFAAYERGRKLLLAAYEARGQGGFNPAGPTLHQGLARQASGIPRGSEKMLRRWSIDAVAAAAGMSAEALMERATLAELTDDKVPAEVAAARGLPQVKAWNSGGALLDRQGHLLSRSGSASIGKVAAPAGGYNFWYIHAEGGEGLSIVTKEEQRKPHHKVTITRLQ